MQASDDNDDNEKLALLRMLLGEQVPNVRLTQLLEAANGRVEQAVDIYFHQQNPTRPVASPSPAAGIPRKQASPTKQKQAPLDSFFTRKRRSTSPSLSMKKQSKQSTTATTATTSETISPNKRPEISHPAQPDAKKKEIAASSKTENRKEDDDDDAWTVLVSFHRLSQVLEQMANTTKRTVKLNALETFVRSILEQESNPPPPSTITTITPTTTPTTIDGNSTTNTADDTMISFKTRILVATLDLVLGGRTTTISGPLNVSESAISKAITTRLGLSRTQLSKAYRQYGDLGDVAASFFQNTKPFFTSSRKKQVLSILDVSEALTRIRTTDGRDAKQHIFLQLFRLCDSRSEIRFLTRLLVGNMRIGANLKTILAALTMAVVAQGNHDEPCRPLSLKEAISLVQTTHDICPSLEKIIGSLLKGGLEQMQRDCTLQVLIPIAPMLAHPIHSLEEVEKAMGAETETEANEMNDIQGARMGQKSILMEWKYDGMRCQAHYDGTTVKLFSRNMLEISEQFPDVGKYILEAAQSVNPGVTSFVVDSEIVAVEGERLLPFQDLSTRRKKIEAESVEGVRVKVFAFDLMYINGESHTDDPLWKRKELLHKHFAETLDFAFVESEQLDVYSEEKLTQYLSNAVEKGAEGLMLKLLGDTSSDETETVSPINTCAYEAGTRSRNWLKMKRDYVAGYADTIDVVPIGAWYGNGRKAQKSFLSPVLLAVYDDEEEVFRSISRCLGFTDKMFESMREFYLHGVPYPAEVDVAMDTKLIQPSEENATLLDDNVENEGMETDSEKEGIHEDAKDNDGTSSDGYNDATGDRVNCFPNRPTSALVVTNESPPIWFKPLEVFEVSFADLSLSQKHTAAAGLVDQQEGGRGVALRFCRFKRRRPDKKPEQATTSLEIAQLFAKQSKTAARNKS